MKKVVVVIDNDGNEAIYCNGFYVENEGDTVYACDIHGVADGQPIVFEHRRVHHQWDADWPIQLKDLELRSRDSHEHSAIDIKVYQPDFEE